MKNGIMQTLVSTLISGVIAGLCTFGIIYLLMSVPTDKLAYAIGMGMTALFSAFLSSFFAVRGAAKKALAQG